MRTHARRYLDRSSPDYMGQASRFLTSDELRNSFRALPDAVRRGGTALEWGGTTAPENPVSHEFARAMEPLSRAFATSFADVVLGDTGRAGKVLDVAAGDGRYGLEIALRDPEAQVYALDWPRVLDVALDNARAAGVSERFHTIPGDAFEVDWGHDYDLVLLVNSLHHFDIAVCTELLRRARVALVPGGRAVALEAVVNEDRVSPPDPAAFSLVMLATTPAGDAYTAAQLESVSRNAGFAKADFLSLPGAPHQAIVASA